MRTVFYNLSIDKHDSVKDCFLYLDETVSILTKDCSSCDSSFILDDDHEILFHLKVEYRKPVDVHDLVCQADDVYPYVISYAIGPNI